MASTARTDELKKKFDENPRRYFAPLANEFRKAGDIDQAILICEEFLPQQPGHMSGHIVYGQALYEAGKLPEARAVFETALALDPENLIALRHLGDIARSQNDTGAARNWYVRVLDADPRNEEIQALIATLDRESPAPEHDVAADAPSSVAAPAIGLGLDIEKEVAPFEKAEPPAAKESAEADPSFAVTAPFGVPVVPPPLPAAPASASDNLLPEFALHGVETHAAGAEESHGGSAPAEGLESTAFSPPDEHIPEAADLDASLESGVPSFSAPTDRIESLAGLEGSGGAPHVREDQSAAQSEPPSAAPLDLDDGLVLPPQGDPLAGQAVAAAPNAQEQPHQAERDELDDHRYDAAPAAVVESVRAPTPAGQQPAWDEPPVARAPFVTETMAELYLAQGLPEQALSVYAQLLEASPADTRLRGVVASLTTSRGAAAESGPNVRDFFARMAERRPGVRRATATPPSAADFAAVEHVAVAESPPEEAPYSVVEAEAEAEAQAETEAEVRAGAVGGGEPSSVDANVTTNVDGNATANVDANVTANVTANVDASAEAYVPAAGDAGIDVAPEAVAPAIERAAAMRTPGGSIDALFVNRPAARSEDSAAAALAQAFGGRAEAPPVIVGRPAHTASGELSLDSVFRDGPARPPRTSQSFSFDQFFASASDTSSPTPPRTSSEIAMPGETPAERSADDIEQFNSWLQGLKQR